MGRSSGTVKWRIGEWRNADRGFPVEGSGGSGWGSLSGSLYQLSQIDGEGLEVSANASPVDFLMAVYRDVRQPMMRRLKAATECAPYIQPKLSAAAVLIGDDFASKLERARAEIGEGLGVRGNKGRRGGRGLIM